MELLWKITTKLLQLKLKFITSHGAHAHFIKDQQKKILMKQLSTVFVLRLALIFMYFFFLKRHHLKNSKTSEKKITKNLLAFILLAINIGDQCVTTTYNEKKKSQKKPTNPLNNANTT